MITIYAEKPDIAIKIAVALSEFKHKGNLITMSNVEKYKNAIEREAAKDGFIKIKYNNKDTYITWGKGHMAGLKQAHDYDPEYKDWRKMPMPFIPNKYDLKVKNKYDFKTKRMVNEPDPWAMSQLNVIKDLFNKSEYIVNATDFDREGEVIFAYVYEMVGSNTPYKRAVIDSVTEKGLQKTFENLKEENFAKPTEFAGRGRAIADWVVGANLTALMSLKYGSMDNPLISVGRVQTPTLNILVQREKEIENFKPEPFWRIKGIFSKESDAEIQFEADHEIKRFDKEEEAAAILNKIQGHKGKVVKYEDKESKRKVPFLYNLTTLSMDANSKYSITASETLNIAQELYSSGYITYPRTSSQHLTDDMKGTVDEVLDALASMDEYTDFINAVDKGSRNYTKRHFDTKKVDSHYAIIPTNQKPKNLNDREKKIYDLIAKSLIRIIYQDAVVKNTEVNIDVNGELFVAKGSVIVDEQWMSVDAKPNFNILPKIEKDDILDGEYSSIEGKTTPPNRYNDQSLLSAMISAGRELDDEKLKEVLAETGTKGIGTEATRAGIIENVIRRYCTRKGKQIIPTQAAIDLIDTLPIEEIKSAEMTAQWEFMLDKIAKEELELESFVEDIENKTREWCKEIEKQPDPVRKNTGGKFATDYTCPVCGGHILKFDWGYTCENNKKEGGTCKLFIPAEIGGKKITKTNAEALLKLETTKRIEGIKKKDGSGTFGAKLFIEKETGALKMDFSAGRNCPKCDGPMNMNKMFYYCTDKACGFSFPYKVASKNLSEKNIDDLLEKGETPVIKGFKSNKGSSFDAQLVMDKESGKVSFKM